MAQRRRIRKKSVSPPPPGGEAGISHPGGPVRHHRGTLLRLSPGSKKPPRPRSPHRRPPPAPSPRIRPKRLAARGGKGHTLFCWPPATSPAATPTPSLWPPTTLRLRRWVWSPSPGTPCWRAGRSTPPTTRGRRTCGTPSLTCWACPSTTMWRWTWTALWPWWMSWAASSSTYRCA